MIPRYESPLMSRIWAEDSKYKYMLEVERALLETLEEVGRVPKGTAEAFEGVEIRVDRINEIERTTRHDTIAFCSSITEQVSPEFGRYFHYGVTSSDVLDTALSLQVRESLFAIIVILERVLVSFSKLCTRTEHILCLGRSHGMAAEPMVFAQKFLSHQAEFRRRLNDYLDLVEREITGQISGAVGNYTVLSPELEIECLAKLNLGVEPISSQVIPRDRLAKIINNGALLASAIERIALEIRHLHRTEVGEVSEGFSYGQKGSSTMPHKKNPIASENLSGIARVIRSHAEIGLQNIVLWHERDISHSSTERLILPDHFGLIAYSLERLCRTLDELELDETRIKENLEKNFKTLSSYVLHELIAANQVSREQLYELVQAATFSARDLDDMINKLHQACKAQDIIFPILSMDWEAVSRKYFEHYLALKKRTIF